LNKPNQKSQLGLSGRLSAEDPKEWSTDTAGPRSSVPPASSVPGHGRSPQLCAPGLVRAWTQPVPAALCPRPRPCVDTAGPRSSVPPASSVRGHGRSPQLCAPGLVRAWTRPVPTALCPRPRPAVLLRGARRRTGTPPLSSRPHLLLRATGVQGCANPPRCGCAVIGKFRHAELLKPRS